MKLCFKYIALYFALSNLNLLINLNSNSLPILVLIVYATSLHLLNHPPSHEIFLSNHYPPKVVLPSPGFFFLVALSLCCFMQAFSSFYPLVIFRLIDVHLMNSQNKNIPQLAVECYLTFFSHRKFLLLVKTSVTSERLQKSIVLFTFIF